VSFEMWLRKYSPPLSEQQRAEIAAKHEMEIEKAKEATTQKKSRK